MLGAVAFLVLTAPPGPRGGPRPAPSWRPAALGRSAAAARAPAIALFGLPVLLSRTAWPPSPRWRWMLWAYLPVVAAWIAGTRHHLGRRHYRAPRPRGFGRKPPSRTTRRVPRPGGVQARRVFPAAPVFRPASFVGQALNRGRSSGDAGCSPSGCSEGQRALVGGGLGVPLSGSPSRFCTRGRPRHRCGPRPPVSMGVAILKYRLSAVDRPISRPWPTRS